MRFLSERRGSNSRQPAWKAGALPTELLPHFIFGGANINNKFIELQVFFNKNVFYLCLATLSQANVFILNLLSKLILKK